MILKIGEGRWKGSNYESENLDLGTQNILIPKHRTERRLTIYVSQWV
jgi:hypothetical protein